MCTKTFNRSVLLKLTGSCSSYKGRCGSITPQSTPFVFRLSRACVDALIKGVLFLTNNFELGARKTYGNSFHRSQALLNHTVLFLFLHQTPNNHCPGGYLQPANGKSKFDRLNVTLHNFVQYLYFGYHPSSWTKLNERLDFLPTV